jgi:hypothetical protein
MQTALFNGSTSFIGTAFKVTGPPDINRAFTLRTDISDDLDTRRTLGRNIMAIVELAQKAALPLAMGIARHRLIVQRRPLPLLRDRQRASSETVFFTELAKSTVVLLPFQLVPPEEHWSSCDGLAWWGLWLATASPETMRINFEKCVVRASEKFRGSHAHLFCDALTWDSSYARAGGGVVRDRSRDGRPPAKRRRGKTRYYRSASAAASAGVPQSPPAAPSGGASASGRGRGAGTPGPGGAGRGGRGYFPAT